MFAEETLEEELAIADAVDELIASLGQDGQQQSSRTIMCFGDEMNANSAPVPRFHASANKTDEIETQPPVTNKPTPSVGFPSMSIFQKSTSKKKTPSVFGTANKEESTFGTMSVRTIGGGEGLDENAKILAEGKMSPSLLEILYNERTYITKPSKNSGFASSVEYDKEAIQTWTYLRCKDFREYQFKMVETCLFYNTIVCLPTGLGKTFIATNVILNFYNWFPGGKIFFLAPTKPLVNQQIHSVSLISQIKHEDFVELTGEHSSKRRRVYYEQKRIFFMTPQTLENDLLENRLDASKIVCVIYDEAHRAIGNYSYCSISALLDKLNIGIRVVALTATPGNDSGAIQEVITNLKIGKIEMRDETDPDVAPYIHRKRIEKVVIKSTDYVKTIVERVNKLIGKILKLLVNSLVLDESSAIQKAHPNYLGKMVVLKWMDEFTKKKDDYFMAIGPENISGVYQYFKMLLALIGAKKVATEQGLDALGNNIRKFKEDSRTPRGDFNPVRKMILDMEEFRFLDKFTGEGTFNNENHPKLEKLSEILRKFYEEGDNIKDSSKVIVFTNNRASALEIQDCLEGVPGVRSTIFVGQNSTNMRRPGLTQKEQLDILTKFKSNFYNVIVATCIGEEGLDIGEVDLIICYDSGFSPIRMVQRMGRTGRRREGKVIFLLMDGKEHFQFLASMKKSDLLKRYLKDQSISEENNKRKSRVFTLLRKKKAFKNLIFYTFNPRLLPEEVTPKLKFYYQVNAIMTDESEIDGDDDESDSENEKSTSRPKKSLQMKKASQPARKETIVLKDVEEKFDEYSYLDDIDYEEINRILSSQAEEDPLKSTAGFHLHTLPATNKNKDTSVKYSPMKRKVPAYEEVSSGSEGFAILSSNKKTTGQNFLAGGSSGKRSEAPQRTVKVVESDLADDEREEIDIKSFAYGMSSNGKKRPRPNNTTESDNKHTASHMSSIFKSHNFVSK